MTTSFPQTLHYRRILINDYSIFSTTNGVRKRNFRSDSNYIRSFAAINHPGNFLSNDLLLPDVPDMPGTHHHSLQHKQVSSLASEADSPEATSPYSRTPALRNSHKIAERKRRTEMKSLFDTLRGQIPASHGSKSSKWEILSKGLDLRYALNL